MTFKQRIARSFRTFGYDLSRYLPDCHTDSPLNIIRYWNDLGRNPAIANDRCALVQIFDTSINGKNQ
jgi:hypothetical protein